MYAGVFGGGVLYFLLSPPAGQCNLMKIREFTFKDRLKVFKIRTAYFQFTFTQKYGLVLIG